MRFRHATSTSRALYDVFILPTLSGTIPPRTTFSRTVHVPEQLLPLRRSFHKSLIRVAKTRAPEERAQKWNEEITARMVQLVDGETGTLVDEGRPRTKFDVLSSIDLKTHRLVQLSADEPGNWNFIPVCKIVNKKESFQNEQKRRLQAKEQKRTAKIMSDEGVKTLELNWAIDPNNDLLHRLEKMKGFLQEGRRVEIVLASKKGGRKATLDQCEQLLDKITSAAQTLDGVFVKQEFEGRMGGFGKMAFQGKPIVAAKKEQDKDGKQEEDAS